MRIQLRNIPTLWRYSLPCSIGAPLLARLGAPLLARLAGASLVACLVGVVLTIPLQASESTWPPPTCPLCAADLRVPVVPLRASWLDSLAADHARANQALIEHLDSLYESGVFGSPKQAEARRQVHLLARLNTMNAYRDLVKLACDSTQIFEADEATLKDLNARYSDMLLFATPQLQQVRLGLGRVCMHYDVTGKKEGKSIHGGKRLRWRVKDVKLDDVKRRVLSIDLPTGTDDVVEVLLAPHHTYRVEYLLQPGPPAPYEWFLVYDIQGGWLQKSGTHRPTAYMFWVSPPESTRTAAPVTASEMTTNGGSHDEHTPLAFHGLSLELPSNPLVGVRIYIPGLRLRLPLFLPDFNFDDLREIELPLPILRIDYLKNGKRPSWLGHDDNLGFKDWKSYGPVPPAVRLRFPDL